MNYELVGDADYALFPADPAEKWLALEAKCRRSLNELIVESRDLAADQILKLQYMNTVSAAAEELQIAGLNVPVTVANFDSFLMEVTRVSTKLRLRASGTSHAFSVQLRSRTKAGILSHIAKLRDFISSSDISEREKTAFGEKLDELETLVRATRTDFGKAMRVLSWIAAGLFATTSFLADAPNAVEAITALMGQDKIEEDAEQQLIAQAREPLKIEDQRGRVTEDDDLPF